MQSNLRPYGRFLGPAALLGALALLLPLGARAEGARGCGSFDSQAAAQHHFTDVGGGVKHQVGKLDRDHDGVACEELSGPYAGFATLGYNKKHRFFYGTVSMPADPSRSGRYHPCMVGNRRFPDGPRRLNVYKVQPDGSGKPIFAKVGIGVEVRRASGRMVWRADRKHVVPGRYFAEFEKRVRASPGEDSQCPGFRSAIVNLP
jgi:hypothetical protein